jgi:hypothetical protein
LHFVDLFKDLCVSISILNWDNPPNNISRQLVSANPGYQTCEKSDPNLYERSMYEGR